MNQTERLFARILFQYETKGDDQGRTIMYAYNRETLDKLNVERFKFDQSQFISIGDLLDLEGFRCKVVDINFKLEAELYKASEAAGINTLSPTEPTDFNCQIGVFVERVE